MSERFKYKYVIFKTGKQREFMEEIIRATGMTADQLAHELDVSGRSVRDWRREACKMPLTAVKRLVRISGIPMPTYLRLQDQYAHLRAAGLKGGMAIMAKYGRVGGDPGKRKLAWLKWWKINGNGVIQRLSILQPHSVKEPKFSATLAELVGILLGDGGITKYQVVVTLNGVTDKEFVVYVAGLFKKLFGITPGIHAVKGTLAVNIVVSRSNLVKFCVDKLGLKVGHKVRQQVDIPDWIKRNKRFQVACVRGLVDTDGCIFTHRYISNGKRYSYKKFDYTSVSKPLLRSVYQILKNNGLYPYFSRGKSIRLGSPQDMKKYFDIFGTSNPKHLRRYWN